MKNIYIVRQTSSNHGTFGILLADGMPPLRTGELPYLGNRPNISAIPPGSYVCRWSRSPRFGWVYHLRSVPGRSYILIHSGNYCGNEAKGFHSDVKGCIALGTRTGYLGGQKCVLASRVAVRRFNRFIRTEPFKLTIIGEIK